MSDSATRVARCLAGRNQCSGELYDLLRKESTRWRAALSNIRGIVVDGVGHGETDQWWRQSKSSMCGLISSPSIVVAVCWSNNNAGANADSLSCRAMCKDGVDVASSLRSSVHDPIWDKITWSSICPSFGKRETDRGEFADQLPRLPMNSGLQLRLSCYFVEGDRMRRRC
jgi:hypothetical protein